MRRRVPSEGYHRLGVLFGSLATVTVALFTLAALVADARALAEPGPSALEWVSALGLTFGSGVAVYVVFRVLGRRWGRGA